jgi:hypothetical protein
MWISKTARTVSATSVVRLSRMSAKRSLVGTIKSGQWTRPLAGAGGRMGRKERPLDARQGPVEVFASELRKQRDAAGAPPSDMAKTPHVSKRFSPRPPSAVACLLTHRVLSQRKCRGRGVA